MYNTQAESLTGKIVHYMCFTFSYLEDLEAFDLLRSFSKVKCFVKFAGRGEVKADSAICNVCDKILQAFRGVLQFFCERVCDNFTLHFGIFVRAVCFFFGFFVAATNRNARKIGDKMRLIFHVYCAKEQISNGFNVKL